MKYCLAAHTEVVNVYAKYFYDDFIELMSRILGYTHYLQLSYNSDNTLTHEEIHDNLIALTPLMELHDYCLQEFLNGLLLKMNKQSFYLYSASYDYLQVKLSRMLSQEILNATRSGTATTFKIDE